MAAVLGQSVWPGRGAHASGVPRQSNDLIDRRALVDVMAVMESVHPPGSDDEIWMISYMDIMTLLLTLFVLLLAFSRITPQTTQSAPVVHAVKQSQAAGNKSPQVAARVAQTAPIKTLSPRRRIAALPAAPATAVAPVQKPIGVVAPAAFDIAMQAEFIAPPLRAVPQTVVPLRGELVATVPDVPAAVSAREKLLASVHASALGRRVELTADQDNVNLDISDNILFAPGSATLKENGRQVLDELATLLAAQDYTVSVEGHSDNVPFANAHFASNWELSATRATDVTRYLIARGIAAARLRAIGYADTRPRADNATVQGRARNRRVALVLHMPVPATPAAIPSGNNQSN